MMVGIPSSIVRPVGVTSLTGYWLMGDEHISEQTDMTHVGWFLASEIPLIIETFYAFWYYIQTTEH